MSMACAQAPPAEPRRKCHTLLGMLSVDEKATWHPGCQQRAHRQALWGSTSSKHPPQVRPASSRTSSLALKSLGATCTQDQGPPTIACRVHRGIVPQDQDRCPGTTNIFSPSIHPSLSPSLPPSLHITGHWSHHPSILPPTCSSILFFSPFSVCLHVFKIRKSAFVLSHPLCGSPSIYKGVEEHADKHP